MDWFDTVTINMAGLASSKLCPPVKWIGLVIFLNKMLTYIYKKRELQRNFDADKICLIADKTTC